MQLDNRTHPPTSAPGPAPPADTSKQRNHKRQSSVAIHIKPNDTPSFPSSSSLPKSICTSADSFKAPSSPKPTSKKCWATLLTRPSYLPGIVLLHYSLVKHNSKYPLLVMYTSSLPQSCISVLDALEISRKQVDPLNPLMKVDIVASRFEDTWTKLRAFELVEYDTVVLLDGDMLIRRNMDELFEENRWLPNKSWIAANHACVCNLRRTSWKPDDWKPENCAYTRMSHPRALTHPTPVPLTTLPPHTHTYLPNRPRTHTLLNSGLVLLHPDLSLFRAMHLFLLTSPLVETFTYPDQDFLTAFFANKWVPIGWQYNAIKTSRYEHPKMWRDEEVRNCHYIVEKPWKVGRCERVNGGRDAVTHGWWWDEWHEWRKTEGSRVVDGQRRMTAAEVVSREMGEENT